MKSLRERAKKVVSPVLGRYFGEFEVSSGEGGYLFGKDKKKYLDFATGIACNVIGHTPPAVVKAIKVQAEKLLHVCIGVADYEPYIELCEKIAEIVPIKNAQTFLCQSGTEAVEAAIKLAKYASKKPGILAFKGGFHGRSLGALSVTTSKMKYREGYEPLLPEVYISQFDLNVVEKILIDNPSKIGGIIIEPMLGEGGYYLIEKRFLKGLRALCDKNNILLIFDEVQTGMGHSGKWFASEHAGVIPDIIVMAKGLASGLPIGACIASAELMSKWTPGAHGGTFGGNPVCCAAAVATIKEITAKKYLKNAEILGQYLKERLVLMMKENPAIKDVRGMGLMLGVDLGDNGIVKKVINYCLKNNLVLISTGGDGTVIRFIPPINTTKKQIDAALGIFAKALKNV